jgi:hypothetical protein
MAKAAFLQEDGSFYKQNRFGTEEETIKMLNLEYSCMWC